MSLFSKDATVFFVKQNGLEAYDQATASGKVLSFSNTVVSHQDIIDKPTFEKSLKEFLQQLNTKEALVLISGELLFVASLPLTSLEKEEVTIKSFFEQIPFDEDKIGKKVLVDKEITCIATNNDYYLSLKFMAEQLNIKILGVFPAIFFSNSENITEIVTNLANQQALAEESNFLVPNKDELMIFKTAPSETVSVEENKKIATNNTQYILLAVSVVFLIAIIIFVLIQQGILFSSKKNTSLPPIQSSYQQNTSQIRQIIDSQEVQNQSDQQIR